MHMKADARVLAVKPRFVSSMPSRIKMMAREDQHTQQFNTGLDTGNAITHLQRARTR